MKLTEICKLYFELFSKKAASKGFGKKTLDITKRKNK